MFHTATIRYTGKIEQISCAGTRTLVLLSDLQVLQFSDQKEYTVMTHLSKLMITKLSCGMWYEEID